MLYKQILKDVTVSNKKVGVLIKEENVEVRSSMEICSTVKRNNCSLTYQTITLGIILTYSMMDRDRLE